MKPIVSGVEAVAVASGNHNTNDSVTPEIQTSPVPRTVTKESLRASSGSSTPSSTPSPEDRADEHSFSSSLLNFSAFDPDKERELLSLPLTFLELPITPPPLDQPRRISTSGSFDTPPTTVSVSTAHSPNASRLLSTAAAIARVSSASQLRPAPPIVAVATHPPPQSKSTKQQRRARAVSQASSGSKSRAAQAVSPGQAQFDSRRIAPRPFQTKRHAMDRELQPPSVSHPQTTLATPAMPVKPASAPSAAAIHSRAGQPLPPRKYAPATAQNNHGAMATAPVYHHAHPPPVAAHQQPHPRAPSSNGHSLPPATASTQVATAVNMVNAVHAGTGQVENTGRWTAEEHRLFLQGLEAHGKGWKKIATLIKSRTVVQIRTHAQKYFQKLAKARQNGEVVGGVLQQPHVGQTLQGHPVAVGGISAPQGHATVHIGTAEGGELGVAVPVGPDGQPVVTMRTTTHPSIGAPQLQQIHGANMSLGCDATSLAAAAGRIDIGAANRGGRRRKGAVAPGGGTKRRAIGNVVRSAVREGRNIKRQRLAEGRRKSLPGSVAPGTTPEDQVPNPLPAVSNVLDPYVTTNAAVMRNSAVAPSVVTTQGKKNGRGRQQLVDTATHGTLPMAVLEDAVFRLLTPATGAPSPPPVQRQPQASGAVKANLDVPAPVSNKVSVTHTQYRTPAPASGIAHAQGIPNGMSPTGVAEMSLLPAWVDAKNPPSWYNEGSDIDTLLEDADYLNWLGDTGDLEETYPPALAEPAAAASNHGRVPINSEEAIPIPEPAPVVATHNPTNELVHPSVDSLSFLVDAPEERGVAGASPALSAPPAQEDQDVDAGQPPLSSFLEVRTSPPPMVLSNSTPPAPIPEAPTLSKATAVAGATLGPEHTLAGVGESETNLLGFPDLDMGDEQAFVSALLETSGPSSISFPKLGSDMHMSQVNMSNSATSMGNAVSAGEERENQEKM